MRRNLNRVSEPEFKMIDHKDLNLKGNYFSRFDFKLIRTHVLSFELFTNFLLKLPVARLY
jgi:hypothetical protein